MTRRWVSLGMMMLTATGATAGGQVNEFLLEGFGARSQSAGVAFTAVANDSSAIYWNPAGLSFLPNRDLEIMSRQRYRNSLQDYSLALGWPGSRWSWGVAFYQTTSGDISQTGALTPDQITQLQFGSFLPPLASAGAGTRDSAVFLSLSRLLGKSLALGVTAKGIDRDLAGVYRGHGYGVDAGALYRRNQWSVGVSAQDIAQGLTWKGTDSNGDASTFDENGDFTWRVGAAYRFDVMPQHYFELSAGSEGRPTGFLHQISAAFKYEALFLRGGLSMETLKAEGGFETSTEFQPALGVGLEFDRWAVAYATRYHVLGWSQTASLTFKWGARP